jgi:monoamine oxidase
MRRGRLTGRTVVVAGAGLAGLTAARDLEADGASVTVVEARERVGGRVWTIRDGFEHRQHAEAGADLIEEDQRDVRELARQLGLDIVPILKGGWGFYGSDRRGRHRIHAAPRTFAMAADRLRDEIRDYTIAGERWDSAVAIALGRRSVAQWLEAGPSDPMLAAGLRGLRGFYLADPEDLSLLVLVEQFASDGAPGAGRMYRLKHGNDRLPHGIAKRLGAPVMLEAIVRRISQDAGSVRVTIEQRGGRSELRADYCVSALPASTLRDVEIDPGLPDEQRRAIVSLRYGHATRVLLQFKNRFWNRRGRPRAFGTDLPIGAVWDGNEQQRGSAGMLTLLAGGAASQQTQDILKSEGEQGIVRRLEWLGTPTELSGSRRITWESDPWARGGYAFFDPGFDPQLRSWLSRPAGRILFAGEHTSDRWQGYMNGAVESGRRAAAEVRAMASVPTGTLEALS